MREELKIADGETKCVREAVGTFDHDARALIAFVHAPYKISVRFNDATKTESVLSAGGLKVELRAR